MKVLHICKVYSPTVGGVQEVVSRLTGGLKHIFNFTVLTTGERNTSCKIDDVRIIRKRKFFDYKSMPVSIGLFFSVWSNMKKFDRICVHYPFPIVDMAIALYPLKSSKLIVYWHSEIVSQKFLKIIVLPFTYIMLLRANKIVVSSPKLIEFSSFLSKFKHKCHVIPFGLEDLHAEDTLGELSRKETNCLKLVSVGRHVAYKGFDVLIKAIQQIDCELIIVGDGPLLFNHQTLAGELSVEGKVEFVTDASDKEVAARLHQADVFVLPSILPSEAFALVQIEAMCFGTPIINTNLKSGVPWVARNGKEAITVEPNDSDELRAAINELSSDRKFLARLGENARDRYLKVFTLDVFMEKTKLLYYS